MLLCQLYGNSELKDLFLLHIDVYTLQVPHIKSAFTRYFLYY